jgi:ATP adenylyltransferase
MAYIRAEKGKTPGCVLCRDSLRGDELVVCEGTKAVIMMNRYPYTCGHLMIVPHRHLCHLDDLTSEERLELFAFQELSLRALTAAMKPEGFNIGMNLGKAAGAGIDDHLHLHVVPRWVGDTNFVSVIGELRVIPEDVTGTAGQLRPIFERFQREVGG